MPDPQNITLAEHTAIHAAIADASTNGTGGAHNGLSAAAAVTVPSGAFGRWASNNDAGDVHHGTYTTAVEMTHSGKQ